MKLTNKYVRRIGEKAGIEKDITTYTARHSFATMLKRKDVATSFIMDMVGHADERTTQNYLDSIELEDQRKTTENLLDF